MMEAKQCPRLIYWPLLILAIVSNAYVEPLHGYWLDMVFFILGLRIIIQT